ncbi:MAG: type II and III secretion system protein family protein [Proteobacteria bacterium]|nr:type II and III secretion system protein family protein [Pseudomonadota bacterium]
MIEWQNLKKFKDGRKRGFITFCTLLCFMFSSTLACAKTITLELGDASVIKFKEDVSEIFISTPETADIQLSNPRMAYLFGKAPGTTKLYVMNKKGQEILKATVVVTHNLSQLKEMLLPFDPYELVELQSVAGAIVLMGQVDSPKTAEEIVTVTKNFLTKGTTGSAAPTVINRLAVKTPVQVDLRVKIAEVSRSILNRFGINWQTTFANVGRFNFGALTGIAPFTANPMTDNVTAIQPQTTSGDDIVGFNVTSGHANVNAAITALSKDGLVTILAEPNLVAISGETASFLAGGEFPYPVPQSFGQVTVQFKQYGVSLAFTPTVLDGGLISMRVRPEVSELDPTNSTVVLGQLVPGILTRRAETTVELASGQSFAIAGLIKNIGASGIDALPGLGDLPILGSLFRSNQFKNLETELVIIVTPYLVEPAAGKELLSPTDGLVHTSFVEQIFERRLVKEGPQKGQAPLFGPGGIRLVGPAGFSIE